CKRERRADGVDARTVRETGVDARAGLIDAPAERGDDPVDDAQDVLVVEEDAIDALDLALALDVDVVGPIDHDLGDRRIGEEWLPWSAAGDIADLLCDEPV